ncbi:LacI family DNA-binding transcriptional regulator [Verrucomicrobium sp. BvORR034]|uniref:LacI family DNA-binding transcriptional regulator n=1 Tax=Verrucomicrobium sp. BvORR034 TaxID=1396418 RepID=UPI002240F81C|nr:LacI family DNA-binding transcriptional regulator [Verrucomicrobium sp. BvORR034]
MARVAGVSAMTVSRVLHNSPKVSMKTRETVMEVARQLKYQPDAHLTRMMHLVRGRKDSKVRAVIAVIRESLPQDDLHDPAYQYVSIKDIQKRAEQHGYHAEEFWLGREGMTPGRLADILQARGIEGIIISPQSSQMKCAQFDFSRFSAATFGYGLREPSLHRSAGNMTLGIHRATEELTARGYQRIGLAITQWVDKRAESAYSGAMLHYQEGVLKKNRVPLLLFPHNDLRKCGEIFSSWVTSHRPDAIISFDTHVPGWLKKLGLRVPEDIGLVVHDWTDAMVGMAGIHQRREHVASAAVDLVATQLLHHERGVPEVPRQILIPPAWVDGASIRPRTGT